MGPRSVDVKVILKSDKEPVDFELVPVPSLPGGTTKNEFVFENLGHDGFWLNFILEGDALGYRFPDDEEDALYSAKGNCCPKTKGQWSQFKGAKVEQGNKILTVRNKNKDEEIFGYTIRLTKTPHKSDPVCIELDPVGQNKNGSYNAPVLQLALAAGAGAAFTVAVLFAFGFLRFQ